MTNRLEINKIFKVQVGPQDSNNIMVRELVRSWLRTQQAHKKPIKYLIIVEANKTAYMHHNRTFYSPRSILECYGNYIRRL